MGKVNLVIKNGLFVLRSDVKHYPTVEELYSYEFSNAALSGIKKEDIIQSSDVQAIRFRRKPCQLKYAMPAGHLIPKCNGEVLEEEQIKSLVKYGYAIIDNKFYPCSIGILTTVTAISSSIRGSLRCALEAFHISYKIEGSIEYFG